MMRSLHGRLSCEAPNLSPGGCRVKRGSGPVVADNPFDRCIRLRNDAAAVVAHELPRRGRRLTPRTRMSKALASIEQRLRRDLGSGLLTQEPLRHHTTFRIGGPADFLFAARTTDHLVAALRVGAEVGLPVFLLGGGSNLLVSDEGYRGLVVRNACETLQFDGAAVHVECGADFLDLIFRCRDRGVA